MIRRKNSYTKVPKMGGNFSRANAMRSYLGGGTDQFGTVQMHSPGRTLLEPEAGAPAAQMKAYDRDAQRRLSAPEVNRPQGEGVMSAAWTPPPPARVNPFEGLGLLNETKLLADWNRNPDVRRTSGDVFVSQTLNRLGDKYTWDEGSQRFTLRPAQTTRGF